MNRKLLFFLCGFLISFAPFQSALASESADLAGRTEDPIPAYQRVLPQWGVQVSFAPNTFTQFPLLTSTGVNVNALLAQFEFQPAVFQKLGFGILGAGVSAGIYPTSPIGVMSQPFFSFYSVGVQVRYQARFVLNQVVVPSVGYSFEYFTFQFNGQTGWFSLPQNGLILSLQILLNTFDSGAANKFYMGVGVSRSYLIIESRAPSNGNSAAPTQFGSWYYGLRLEY